MEIPMNAQLKGADGEAGQAVGALIAEATRTVTHLVVHLGDDGPLRRLLPLNTVIETTPDSVLTRLTKQEVDTLSPLDDVELVPSVEPMDLATGMMAERPIAVEEAPKNTLVIDKRMSVEASDGRAGSVDAILVDPVSGALTHIILREGHFWAQRDVTIPAGNISAIRSDAIALNLNKQEIGRLPTLAE